MADESTEMNVIETKRDPVLFAQLLELIKKIELREQEGLVYVSIPQVQPNGEQGSQTSTILSMGTPELLANAGLHLIDQSGVSKLQVGKMLMDEGKKQAEESLKSLGL